MSPGPGWNMPCREDRPHVCSLLCFPVVFLPPARALGPSHSVSPQNPAHPRRLVHDIQAGPFLPCSPAAGTVPCIQQALSKCLANIGLLHLQEVLRPLEWPGSRSPASVSPVLCSAPAQRTLGPSLTLHMGLCSSTCTGPATLPPAAEATAAAAHSSCLQTHRFSGRACCQVADTKASVSDA